MLTQLKLAGKLDDAAGIILGAWTNCGPQNAMHPEQSLRLQTIFEEILVPTGKPILMDVACGHILPTMTLPLGRTVTINADDKTISAKAEDFIFAKQLDEVVSSASLIKVPILIAVLELIERQNISLQMEVEIKQNHKVEYS
ncbi:hypothetical protein RhiirA1_486843, partial [Rhizophagus irregularis]